MGTKIRLVLEMTDDGSWGFDWIAQAYMDDNEQMRTALLETIEEDFSSFFEDADKWVDVIRTDDYNYVADDLYYDVEREDRVFGRE